MTAAPAPTPIGALGACISGPKLTCNDHNTCTVDVCDSKTGCVHQGGALDKKPCDDGNACTAADVCAGSTCLPGALTECADGNACTADSCDPATGCAHSSGPFDGVPCADTDACTIDETCKSGACVVAKRDCDDANPCTVDSCAAQAGCLHDSGALQGKPCAHPAKCVKGTMCAAGVCGGGDASGCGNLGDCSVQSDALGHHVADGVGTATFVFQAGGGGFALVSRPSGEIAAYALTHPVAAQWQPAWVMQAPVSVEPARPVAGALTSDGGLIIGGGVAQTGSGGATWHSWIRRVGSDGVAVWSTGPAVAAAPIRDIAAHSDGSFSFAAGPTPSSEVVVVRFTAAGKTVWQRKDRGPSPIFTRDRWDVERLVALGGGGLLAVGSIGAPTQGAGADQATLAVRYNALGTAVTFARTLAGGASARWHDAVALANGTFRAVGERQQTASSVPVAWHALLSAGGEVLMTADIALGVGEAVADAVRLAPDGGLVVAAHGRVQAGTGNVVSWLLRLGADNKPVWSSTYAAKTLDFRTCSGCLAAALGDGWRLGAMQQASTSGAQPAGVFVRVGPWGHDSCSGAQKCGSLDLGACNDKLACTLDVCEPTKGCTHTPSGAVCADGNECTDTLCDLAKGCVAIPKVKGCKLLGSCAVAQCTAGQCKATGELIDCNDSNPCTADLCSTVEGCVHTPLTTGSLCRNIANCKEGTCSAQSACSHVRALDCYDADPCTADSCTPGKGCAHAAIVDAPCNDGDSCTTGDVCKNGMCAGTRKSCGAGKACTAGACHNATCSTTGLTFTAVVAVPGTEPIVGRFVAYPKAYGFPPDGNPYKGDTACSTARPVLCIRKWGYAYPQPYSSWSKGELRASPPVIGCGVTSAGVGNKICSDAFGSGWYWFSWQETGQESYGWTVIPRGTRMWTLIKDQTYGNCWK